MSELTLEERAERAARVVADSIREVYLTRVKEQALVELRAVQQETARECAEIAVQPRGSYQIGMKHLPYWDGEEAAAAIRRKYGLGESK